MFKSIYEAISQVDAKKVSSIFSDASFEDMDNFNINSHGCFGHKTLLYVASGMTSENPEEVKKVVDTLISYDADVNSTNGVLKEKPLHAVFHPEIASTLVKNGAKVNAKDGRGWTALHYAVYRNNLPLVRKLIELGANTLEQDIKGKKPSDLLTDKHSEELRAFIQQKTKEAENEQKNKKAVDASRVVLETLSVLGEVLKGMPEASDELTKNLERIAKDSAKLSKFLERRETR